MHELFSLVDPKNAGGNPDFQPSYPVPNVLNKYGSAATPANAWKVHFNNGNVNNNKTNSNHAWCVRSEHDADQ